MRHITKRWLTKHGACEDSYGWLADQGTTEVPTLYKRAMRDKMYDDINWALVRLMTKRQRVRYAVYAARLVLRNYEDKYPNDDGPRKAIEAAERYLTTRRGGEYLRKATSAATSATSSYAASAAYAASSSYAASAAYSAYAASTAAYSAAFSATSAHSAAYITTLKRIVRHGYKILTEPKYTTEGK
jgi:hypothetical protein